MEGWEESERAICEEDLLGVLGDFGVNSESVRHVWWFGTKVRLFIAKDIFPALRPPSCVTAWIPNHMVGLDHKWFSFWTSHVILHHQDLIISNQLFLTLRRTTAILNLRSCRLRGSISYQKGSTTLPPHPNLRYFTCIRRTRLVQARRLQGHRYQIMLGPSGQNSRVHLRAVILVNSGNSRQPRPLRHTGTWDMISSLRYPRVWHLKARC